MQYEHIKNMTMKIDLFTVKSLKSELQNAIILLTRNHISGTSSFILHCVIGYVFQYILNQSDLL